MLEAVDSPAMECLCFLPTCSSCHPRAKSQSCGCFLPTCAVCGAGRKHALGRARLIHSGTALSPDVLRLIAKVDLELEKAFEVGIITKGPNWSDLPSWTDGSQGSRKDNFTAQLCGAGVYVVDALLDLGKCPSVEALASVRSVATAEPILFRTQMSTWTRRLKTQNIKACPNTAA